MSLSSPDDDLYDEWGAPPLIIDSSAVIAILRDDPEADSFKRAMQSADTLKMSTATALEIYLVERPQRSERVAAFLAATGMELVPFDGSHHDAARHALVRFGRGSQHPANLNFGDCVAYALAKVTGEPLLFKGDDFRHTDVEPAYRPDAGRSPRLASTFPALGGRPQERPGRDSMTLFVADTEGGPDGNEVVSDGNSSGTVR